MEHSQKQNSAAGFYIFADDATELGTGKTALAIATTLSKEGGAANSVAPTITEIGSGVYWVEPISAHRDTLGRNSWAFSAAGAVIAPRFEKIVAVDDQASSFSADWADGGRLDLLLDAVLAELSSSVEPGQGLPPATATRGAKIDYLYKAWRNRKTQTETTLNLYADDGTTVDQKATVSDDGTTADIGEIESGP